MMSPFPKQWEIDNAILELARLIYVKIDASDGDVPDDEFKILMAIYQTRLWKLELKKK